MTGERRLAPVAFPRFSDERGELIFLQEPDHVPFPIRSVWWWSGEEGRTPETRHADEGESVVFALAGAANLTIRRGDQRTTQRIDRPDTGVHLHAGDEWIVTECTHDAVGVVVSANAPRAAALARAPEGADALRPPSDAGLPVVDDIQRLRLPVFFSGSVRCVSADSERSAPFAIRRLYALFGVPSGHSRGAHAHIGLQQLIVAVQGTFSIRLDDGTETRTVTLNRLDEALYVPQLIWRDLFDFSADAVCLVLASLPYDAKDYIHDHGRFMLERSIRSAALVREGPGLHSGTAKAIT